MRHRQIVDQRQRDDAHVVLNPVQVLHHATCFYTKVPRLLAELLHLLSEFLHRLRRDSSISSEGSFDLTRCFLETNEVEAFDLLHQGLDARKVSLKGFRCCLELVHALRNVPSRVSSTERQRELLVGNEQSGQQL